MLWLLLGCPGVEKGGDSVAADTGVPADTGTSGEATSSPAHITDRNGSYILDNLYFSPFEDYYRYPHRYDYVESEALDAYRTGVEDTYSAYTHASVGSYPFSDVVDASQSVTFCYSPNYPTLDQGWVTFYFSDKPSVEVADNWDEYYGGGSFALLGATLVIHGEYSLEFGDPFEDSPDESYARVINWYNNSGAEASFAMAYEDEETTETFTGTGTSLEDIEATDESEALFVSEELRTKIEDFNDGVEDAVSSWLFSVQFLYSEYDGEPEGIDVGDEVTCGVFSVVSG